MWYMDGVVEEIMVSGVCRVLLRARSRCDLSPFVISCCVSACVLVLVVEVRLMIGFILQPINAVSLPLVVTFSVLPYNFTLFLFV